MGGLWVGDAAAYGTPDSVAGYLVIAPPPLRFGASVRLVGVRAGMAGCAAPIGKPYTPRTPRTPIRAPPRTDLGK